jgi:hypothetical protein
MIRPPSAGESVLEKKDLQAMRLEVFSLHFFIFSFAALINSTNSESGRFEQLSIVVEIALYRIINGI